MRRGLPAAPVSRRVGAVVDPRPPILSLSASELAHWFKANGAPAYRSRQVMGWLARGVTSFDVMHDVPKPLRSALARDFRATSLKPVATSVADRGLTTKTLFELAGGHSVEAVVM